MTSKLEQAPKSRVNRAKVLSQKVFTGAIAQVKNRYTELKRRYGPRYYKAMLGVAFFTFFLPIPGSLLIGVAVIVLIAEVHVAISKRGGLPETVADLILVVRANMPSWMRGRRRSPPG